MILTQTNSAFPLSSVKPLEGIRAYRQFCLETVKQAVAAKGVKRDVSPISGSPLIAAGAIDGLSYGRCIETGSLFLQDISDEKSWASVLSTVHERRQSPNGFHASVAGSRTENVYLPKLDWIQNTIQIQGLNSPALLEVATLPSRFSSLLKSSGSFRTVNTVSETDVAAASGDSNSADAAVMLESLDRAGDPKKLLDAVYARLKPGGLLFLTALVSSGFDMILLGFDNLYFCPPDRTNAFTLKGLDRFVRNAGFHLLEVSTPGVLDVEIVQAHAAHNPSLALSPFEEELMSSRTEVKQAFQSFLQQGGLSSFARIVGRKQ